MLSTDTHCEMLVAQIRDKNVSIYDGFKLFVQLFAAIVGGSVVLRLQYGPAMLPYFANLSEALVVLIFATSTVIILENLRSLHQYKIRLSNVAGMDKAGLRVVPLPRTFAAHKVEVFMFGVMLLAMMMFHMFNPLRM